MKAIALRKPVPAWKELPHSINIDFDAASKPRQLRLTYPTGEMHPPPYNWPVIRTVVYRIAGDEPCDMDFKDVRGGHSLDILFDHDLLGALDHKMPHARHFVLAVVRVIWQYIPRRGGRRANRDAPA